MWRKVNPQVDPGGPWGPSPPLPTSFSKSCSFQAILRENPVFWENFEFSPPWGKSSAGPLLTKILDSRWICNQIWLKNTLLLLLWYQNYSSSGAGNKQIRKWKKKTCFQNKCLENSKAISKPQFKICDKRVGNTVQQKRSHFRTGKTFKTTEKNFRFTMLKQFGSQKSLA